MPSPATLFQMAAPFGRILTTSSRNTPYTGRAESPLRKERQTAGLQEKDQPINHDHSMPIMRPANAGIPRDIPQTEQLVLNPVSRAH